MLQLSKPMTRFKELNISRIQVHYEDDGVVISVKSKKGNRVSTFSYELHSGLFVDEIVEAVNALLNEVEENV